MEALLTSLLGSKPTLTVVALAVVVIVILAFIRGWITPKWITKSLLDARETAVTQANLRAEDFKALFETEQKASAIARGQVTELLVTAETTRRIVNAIPVQHDEGTGL